jgi:glycosyltransferase involved in cell wall biosynthesis
MEIAGGSEQLCRALAEHLNNRGECEVLTTCASDYMTWQNVLPPGVSDCNGVRVRRFPVDQPRNIAKFNEFSSRVLGGPVSREDEEQWMRMQGPCSSALLEYLRAEKSGYDAFVFFTYLYATTYFGLPLVKEKAVMVPTAHDEPPVYLSIFDSLFQKAGRLLFLTPEEQEFVYRRFALPADRGEVVGVGIQDLAPPEELPDALRSRIAGQPYVLYLGRVDPSKGCGVLVDYFQRFRQRNPSSRLRLVLAGKAAMKIAEDENIVATGYLTEGAKTRCIDDALCMVTPSPYESLCLAALEAWARGKPVLANAECRVLVGQCRRSGGGLWYGTYPEFEECLRTLVGNASLRGRMGASGADFVARSYAWEHSGEHYWRNIKSVAGE